MSGREDEEEEDELVEESSEELEELVESLVEEEELKEDELDVEVESSPLELEEELVEDPVELGKVEEVGVAQAPRDRPTKRRRLVNNFLLFMFFHSFP